MTLNASALSRLEVRLREPKTVALLACSIGALGIGYATSSGRKLAAELKDEHHLLRRDAETGHVGPWLHLKRVIYLLRLAVPGLRSKECRMMAAVVALVVARISVTLHMADVMGSLAGSAMEGNLRGLAVGAVRLIASCVPASLVDASLDYVKEALELSFRVSLSQHYFERYLTSKVFFRLAGLHEVENVQVKITDGIAGWCSSVTTLFTSFLRAGLEAVVFSRELGKRTGWRGPALAWLFYGVFSIYAVKFAPSSDQLATLRLKKIGAFRYAHQSIRSFAEEITLLHSTGFIESLTGRLFQRITDHARMGSFLHCRFQLGNVAIFRYISALMSILIGALGVFHSSRQRALTAVADDPSIGVKVFSRTTYTFSVLSTALNHILANIRLFNALSGYTNELFETTEGLEFAEEDVLFSQSKTPDRCRSPLSFSSPTSFSSAFSSVVSQGDHIQFIDVPLTLPSGKCICHGLTFYVRKGMNLLITGPNGCGKSSTLRLLGELWPLQGGTLIKPPPQQLYYVPQRPYMFDGTLLEQIIYPHRKKEMRATEEELRRLLKVVGLESLMTEANLTWDSFVGDTLSCGEKQRLALARLFYHAPQYAILDECSSTMDPDVERRAYEHCHRLGISLITVAHRRSVWKYHNWVLRFDGRGGYLFSPLQVDEKKEVIHLTGVEQSNIPSAVGQSMTFHFEEIITEETVML